MSDGWVHVVPEQLDGKASILIDAGLVATRLPPMVAPCSTSRPPGCTVTSPPIVTLLKVHVAPDGTLMSLPLRLFGNVGVPLQSMTAALTAGAVTTPSAPTN